MYPSNFYSLFPPFPRENTCFVAMSFAPQFELRWNRVIKPAIEAVLVNGVPLRSVRVDQRTINDSILTEILTGIGQCRVVFADVTSLGRVDGRPVRNGNVMYEVGIAHAVRSPAEVVLFRSDDDPLLFDVANVRVNSYDPDRHALAAVAKLNEALLNGLREVELLRSLTVRQAAERLDVKGWELLNKLSAGPAWIDIELFHTLALSRLLDAGLVTMEYEKATTDKLKAVPDLNRQHFCRYRLTTLGVMVNNYILVSGEYHLAEQRMNEIRVATPMEQNPTKE
jgi:hypothetical protein